MRRKEYVPNHRATKPRGTSSSQHRRSYPRTYFDEVRCNPPSSQTQTQRGSKREIRFCRAPPPVEATATAQDLVPAQETGPEKNPFLWRAPPVETTAATEDPVPDQETGLEENPLLS